MPRMLGPKPIVIPPPLPWQTPEPELGWREQLRRWPRSRWVIAGLAVLTTLLIMTGFMLDARSLKPGRVVTVVRFENWRADRSAADIAADRQAGNARIAADLAASRAYIAGLPPARRAEAVAGYNAYAASLKPSQRPADAMLPVPPAPR